ncbi:1-deoxy-D-xylulose-5-phosphate synthase [Candidatus Marinamargulisbacteria bacterium SCGC AG-343-D04]|nr:1-deoxy-D-xylulose-5-phosphate synthase [Candidatus Marinamargulisbacteria bacterium SCGC AG-343-D04]
MVEKKSTTLLDHLTFPEDLKELTLDELDCLCAEVRQRLLEISTECGGHLASNLGVVEITIVLHTLFSSPTDKIVFDTSHQSYVHKMLTGRLDQMFSIRKEHGLSGFANIFESDHDIFGAGHASTALSSGLGLAHSRELLDQDHSVISIIGDSSLSGGMCFEALNNFEKLNSNFICILNDNDMSISHPVGNMSTYMTKVRTSPGYDSARKFFDTVMSNIPKGGPLKRRIEKGLDCLRDYILDTKVGVIFEEFGFQYLGPIDGHNVPMLMAALKYAKNYDGPILIHTITQKGKGHEPAEHDPIKYHGLSPKKPGPSVKKPLSNSEFFGDVMIEICNKRDDVVVITPAMVGGSGLTKFADTHPKKLFDVGIAEEHAVTFCAGLSRGGIKPVLAIYSTFLQRGFDQFIHDVCIQKLPMVFALDRAGFAGEDGATHHGVFDYTYMLPIPNVTILAPKDAFEIEHMLKWAVDQDRIVSIRYPKGSILQRNDIPKVPISLSSEVMIRSQAQETEFCLVGVGSMAWECYDAAQSLIQQGHSCTVINLRSLKPLDTDTLDPLLESAKNIIVVEEGMGIGGVFSHLIQSFSHLNKSTGQWHHIAIPDRFFDHGSIPSLRNQCGLSKDGIELYILSKVRELSHTS